MGARSRTDLLPPTTRGDKHCPRPAGTSCSHEARRRYRASGARGVRPSPLIFHMQNTWNIYIYIIIIIIIISSNVLHTVYYILNNKFIHHRTAKKRGVVFENMGLATATKGLRPLSVDYFHDINSQGTLTKKLMLFASIIWYPTRRPSLPKQRSPPSRREVSHRGRGDTPEGYQPPTPLA